MTFDESVSVATERNQPAEEQRARLNAVMRLWDLLDARQQLAIACLVRRIALGDLRLDYDTAYAPERIHERFDDAWCLVGRSVVADDKRRLLAAIEADGPVAFADAFVGRIDRRRCRSKDGRSHEVRRGVLVPFKSPRSAR